MSNPFPTAPQIQDHNIQRAAVMPPGYGEPPRPPQFQTGNPFITDHNMPPGYSPPQWTQQVQGEFGMGPPQGLMALQQDPRFQQNPGMRPSLANLGGSFTNDRQRVLGNPNSLPVQLGRGRKPGGG